MVRRTMLGLKGRAEAPGRPWLGTDSSKGHTANTPAATHEQLLNDVWARAGRLNLG
jgi:hypothetical protein